MIMLPNDFSNNGSALIFNKPPNQTQHFSVANENYIKEGEKKNSALSTRFTQQPIEWYKMAMITFLHVTSIYGFLAYIHRVKLLTIIWAYFIGTCTAFGITAGVHRLWSHGSYKAKLPLKIILMICYSMTGMNSIYSFVRDHRIHHKFTDTDADPHNSKRGFWFSHVGWLVQKKHPDVISKQSLIDMSDITGDPLLNFHSRHYKYFQILFSFVLPTIPPIWLWNEYWLYSALSQIFRLTVILNSVFSINSFAHMWGQRPYNKKIKPTDSFPLALWTWGEGWHNFHHTFPWDYRSSELGVQEINFTTTALDMFQKIGWVYDVKVASPELITNTKKKYGDGSRISEIPVECADESRIRYRERK